ncbi:MAG: sodium:solute symporter [bacterium]
MSGLTGWDWTVLVVYMTGSAALGLYLGRRARSVEEYFLGGRDIPWVLAAFSIVATETSTLTVISVPGLAYTGDMTFLQLAFGYVLGRIAAALLLVPFYIRGRAETAYAYLGQRFGRAPQQAASVLFLITRLLADGVRLFATAIPLALMTGWSYPACILVIGAVTVVYTYVGGIRSVVWLDGIQLVLYVSGAAVALWLVLGRIGGWEGMLASLPAGKLAVVDLGADEGIRGLFTGGYKLPAALLGGAFLSMASHGTDQLLVQRLLATRGLRQAQVALIASGVLVVLQFLLFLVLGAALYAAYGGVPMIGDEVFPRFIVEGLPAGLSGLLLAAIFAAAMSTLSSSLNALASSTVLDLGRRRQGQQDRELGRGRLATLFWALVLVGFAMLFRSQDNPVVEVGLAIASVTYGGFLGVFLLGRLTRRPGQRAAVAAMGAGVLTGTLLALFSGIFWVWLVPLGCGVSLLTGLLAARLVDTARPAS